MEWAKIADDIAISEPSSSEDEDIVREFIRYAQEREDKEKQ
jgi:hypothetical protein